MRLGYDPQKNAWNIQERGLAFDDVALLDWSMAVVRQDRRKDYGEDRFQALVEGEGGKPYVVVFTMCDETIWARRDDVDYQLPPRPRQRKKKLWQRSLIPS